MDNNDPLVSIIIPTHNRHELLTRALRSVFAQTFEDYELIIIDDGSSDATRACIDKLADGRIIYIRHEKCRGGAAARNTGIRQARGKYISFLDDDDEWLPEKLNVQVKKMESVTDKAGVIYCGCEIIYPGEKGYVRVCCPEYRGDLRYELLKGTTLCGGLSAVLARKECFEKAGMFDEALSSCQDWDMWKRIADHYEFEFVPDVLSRNYIHYRQISTDYGSLIPGRTKMIRKHMKDLARHPRILVSHLKRLGKINCLNGTWREAFYWFREAARIKKTEIFKISAWCVFEFPVIRFFSRFKKFSRFRGDRD
ncbi:MAG: glycosyltransferase family 2 protein [Candidatus Omnitrophota bacterium]